MVAFQCDRLKRSEVQILRAIYKQVVTYFLYRVLFTLFVLFVLFTLAFTLTSIFVFVSS